MSKSKDVSGGGVGFLSLLGVLFIGLKLTHQIDWSWWYVLAPLWGPLVLGVSLMALAGVISLITSLLD